MRSPARWIAALVAAPWVAWAVGRTLGLDRVHPLIAVVAFTPYAAATAAVPVLVALVLRRWATAAVAAVAALLLALAVVPRTLDDRGRADPSGAAPRTVTVMAANLYVGRADVRHVLAVAREEGADVLCLTELTADALRRLDAAGARRRYPERVVQDRTPGAGEAILAAGRVRRAAAQVAPAADVAVGGGAPLRVLAVHPPPPL